ncbi:hypothetical protein ADL26_13680, partial [Thermoactinomyces vulgaris]
DSSVLTEEIIRIKNLVDNDRIQNYLLFSNRRLGANAAEGIIGRISTETGLHKSQVGLAGIEYLDFLLHQFRDVVQLARINPLENALIVSSFEIAEVILAIANQLDGPIPELDTPPVERVTYADKNRLNNMSEAFA